MKNLLLLLCIALMVPTMSQSQAPPNDQIENATLISSFPYSETNVQLGNATTDTGGQVNCNVSETYPVIYYKFTATDTNNKSIVLADTQGGSIPNITSFAIVYSASSINAVNPNELTLISDCVFGSQTNFTPVIGTNYYIAIHRDTSNGLNTDIYFTSESDGPQTERMALLQLYVDLNGNSWTNNTNWNTTNNISTWYGVTTEIIDGEEHVTRILLNNNNSTGVFPNSILNLTYLKDFWIQGSYVSGAIPENIGNLVGLRQLILNQTNGISGTIPASLLNCPDLDILALGVNQLEGQIPDFSTFNLSNLWINDNNFEFGDFETEFTSYQSTIQTFLYNPQGIIGEPYSEAVGIGSNTTLQSTASGSLNSYQWYKGDDIINGATGSTLNVTISSESDYGSYNYEVTSGIVTDMVLTSADFSITNLPNTSDDYDALIALYNSTNGDNWNTNTNWFDNTKPLNSWHGITVDNNRVKFINLGSNNLTGTLTSEIGTFSELEYLYLYSNAITGELPPEIGDLTNLIELDLSPNTFSGSIPSEIGNLTNLEVLWLNQNGLTGSIPQSFQNLVNLRELYLIGTSGPPYTSSAFSGDFPDLTASPLEILNLSRNYFQFSDIEDEFDYYVNNIPFFDYSPQYTVDTDESITQLPGSDITLTLTDVEDPTTLTGRRAANTYQWYKDDVEISGANSNNYTITNAQVEDSGDYYCIITNIDFPDFEIRRAPITVLIDPNLSTTDVAKQELSIYPNPVFNWLTIDLGNQEYAKLQIHDLNGRLILAKELNTNTNSIDISTFQSGMYLLTIASENKSITKRIIKQ